MKRVGENTSILHDFLPDRSFMKYSNSRVLAPMVRIGTLPMRLLALQYGADIVYSPEIIDRRLINSSRIVNEELGTVDFIDDKQNLNIRIHPDEKSRLIVQIGSANPDYAVQAARKVEKDVAGIDLNCGCPKKFSVVGGMGSALLENPDLLKKILTALVESCSVPVTCKIRLLEAKDGKTSVERTIELLKMIESTKVSAIAIHCRFIPQRPREPAHWNILKQLAGSVNIPVIANGDFWILDDIKRFKETDLQDIKNCSSQYNSAKRNSNHISQIEDLALKRLRTKSSNADIVNNQFQTSKEDVTDISSFMFARGAQENVSLFRGKGNMLHPLKVMQDYLKLSIKYQMRYHNAKYVLLQMGYPEDERIEFKKRLTKAKSLQELKMIVFGDENEEL